mmetsp:Transcript_67011/g.111355  ORF Transcript_67011/g.111355 Transcript_67011/m.111355 type:complete len:414 (+) Transcript_67011:111-1352(+)|eukprot:CAMPEP_0119314646 /NCGR_PEP_ID=MMETSP1333-20130426/33527_1 /TAXON_ID=418940 /ORGANISM="Scyphosphaera apsteinii, Strain RCC1455" /LENGTH=413 /DNA_ID=CAMNT_0007319805 /DNA_START=103 /DNA_END=1344 /DNA_ORIENTATION=+
MPISLVFADHFTDASYKLFEMEESVLQELLKNDGSMSIKGGVLDEAVLCTAEQSFVMRLADSSNSLLLLDTSPDVMTKAAEHKVAEPRDTAESRKDENVHTLDPDAAQAIVATEMKISARVQEHFEMIQCSPRIGCIGEMLRACPYAGENSDGAPMASEGAGEGNSAQVAHKMRPSMENLEGACQCSIAELRRTLQSKRAFPIGDRWCTLEEKYEQDIIDCIMALLVEREWRLDALPISECVNALTEQHKFNGDAVRHCLRTHSVFRSAPWLEWISCTSAEHIAIDERMLAQFRARTLLMQSTIWPEDVFLEHWQESLPSVINPEASDLAGLAVIVDEHGPKVKALFAEGLSSAPLVRFATLFKFKPSWSLIELVPYLNDILEPGCTEEQLVLQHARSVVANDGSRSYVKRAP